MASTINAKNTSTGVVITPDASGQLELQTADTTRMTIDVNGNVGIGTTTPAAKLDAVSNANSAQRYLFRNINAGTSAGTFLNLINDTGTAIGELWCNSSTNTAYIGGANAVVLSNFSANPLVFCTNNLERMRIDSSGRVSMPFQVGFKVGRGTSAQTVVQGGACIFNTTATSGGFNTGSAYNTSTGNFTAPIAGRYIFNATVIFESVANGTNFSDIILTVNGGAAAYGLRQVYVTNTTGSGGFFVDKISVILNLAVGDVVAVINNTGSSKTLHANPGFAIFDGYLLG